MLIKTVPMSKKDVEKLSDEELSMLIEWGNSDGFAIAQRLSKEFIQRRTETEMEMVEGSSYEDTGKRMASLVQIRIGLEFFLDSVQRAKEQVEDRKIKTKK